MTFLLPSAGPGSGAWAAGRSFSLSAPGALTESGLLNYLVPRFSLKTATRVELHGDGEAAVARFTLAGAGRPVFEGPQGVWHLQITQGEGADAAGRFEQWLLSEIGRNTIVAYRVAGQQPFRPPSQALVPAAAVVFKGDAALGERLAERHCGRCHMVNERTRMSTIGSTPSFALLRGFDDWLRRFTSFYALRPHPAFTILAGVTEPFDPTRPSPIEPLRMTRDELEQILAFVDRIEPADLGRPLQFQ
ncbi:MAG: cytochrome c [Burkholderiaceae bacterium]